MIGSGLLRRLAASSGILDHLILRDIERLRILTYHGVSPTSLPPALFQRQLEYVAERFECLWLREVPAWLAGTLRTRRPAMVLTFDDGLRNFAEHVAPALAAHGLKATLFVVTDLLDGRSMLWNHELRCRLWLLRDEAPPLPEGVDLRGGPGAREHIDAIIANAKGWPEARRATLLEAARAATPSPTWEPWMLDYLVMGVDELRALPEVVEIGSHTRSHPILPVIDDAQARDEIAGSRVRLEALLGREVVSFCYPNGDQSPRDVALVRDVYRVAVTRSEGIADRHSRVHELPRIPAATDLASFAWRMLRPAGGA